MYKNIQNNHLSAADTLITLKSYLKKILDYFYVEWKHNPRGFAFDKWDYIKCLDCSWASFVWNKSNDSLKISVYVHVFSSCENKSKIIPF